MKSVLTKDENHYYKIFLDKCLYQLAKNNHKNSFHSIMLRFEETKVTKERFYAARKSIRIWDVDVCNIVISKLVKAKANSEYLTGYLDKAVRPLVLIMPKMSGYVKTFKVKDGDKGKNNE